MDENKQKQENKEKPGEKPKEVKNLTPPENQAQNLTPGGVVEAKELSTMDLFEPYVIV